MNKATEHKELIHLLVLNAFAVAQPLFDVLSQNSPFFIAKGAQPLDILLFTFILLACMPVMFYSLLFLVGRYREKLFLFWVFILFTLIFIAPVKTLPQPFPFSDLVIALVLGALGTYLYQRYERFKAFLDVLTPVLVIFPLMFLLFSPVKKVVIPKVKIPAMPVIAKSIPVVLVIFDELPTTSLLNKDRKIDPVLYPNFARFASQATWYENATTVSDRTAFAVPVILSGLYPDRFRPANFKGYPQNLFTLMGKSYHLNVSETTTSLCPANLCKERSRHFISRMRGLVADSFLVYLHIVTPKALIPELPPIPQDWDHFWDKAQAGQSRTQQFYRFVRQITPESRALNMLHLELPHGLWTYFPDGTLYGQDVKDFLGYESKPRKGREAVSEWTQPWYALQGYQQHLLQLQYTDLLLGKLLERLKAQKIDDKALVIFVADHGISFQTEMYSREIDRKNYMDVMPVPLLVKYPGQTSARVETAAVQTVDILPTIADVLGVKDFWKFEGVSFYQTPPVRKTVHTYNKFQDHFEFPVAAMNKKYDTLATRLRYFPRDPLAIQADSFGFPASLIGKTSGPAMTMLSDKQLTWENAAALEDLNPEKGILPALLMGKVSGFPESQPIRLVLKLNGRLAAFTLTEPLKDGSGRFSFLIPPEFFRKGKNDVQVYRLN